MKKNNPIFKVYFAENLELKSMSTISAEIIEIGCGLKC